MDGGAGKDYVNGTTAASAIDVNLTTGVGQGWAAGCTFSGFEAVFGSIFNDTLTANLNLGTMLTGESGNDTLTAPMGTTLCTATRFSAHLAATALTR